MTDIAATLAERGISYGTFFDNASSAQLIKFALRSGANWNKLENDQKEAMEQIASKLGRLLTGDYNHLDSWHDISGYAKLVADRLRVPVLVRQNHRKGSKTAQKATHNED